MEAREFKKRIAAIYEIAHELGREFNITTCTPDGHLLGAIGQIAAKIAFGLIEPCLLNGTYHTFSPAALKNAESRRLWPFVLAMEERKACSSS
jgi:hypothetical protein